MIIRPLVALAFLAIASSPAVANDTMATLGAGGLVFITNPEIEMQSEDLFLSKEEVRVTYRFLNKAETDQTILVAFPMPDITGSGDFMVSVPTDDPENIFGFQTSFDGEPVAAELHQYAFAAGIDQSAVLRELGVPLAPFGEATHTALNALSDADKQRLEQLGMAFPMEYDSGSGWQVDLTPAWTLSSTYSWEATFPAGEPVEVVHTYKPSVGGTVAVTFLAPPYDDYDPATTYKKKYCADEGFINTVKKTLPNPDEPYGAPFTESWLSYIWSTGANWGGPIGEFTLTIDKGRPENLVSFCGENVEKISPTQFRMTAKDFYPPWDRELEVLILERQQN